MKIYFIIKYRIYLRNGFKLDLGFNKTKTSPNTPNTTNPLLMAYFSVPSAYLPLENTPHIVLPSYSGKTQLYLKALPKIHLFAHLPKYSLENFLKTNESTIIGGKLNNPIQNTTLL